MGLQKLGAPEDGCTYAMGSCSRGFLQYQLPAFDKQTISKIKTATVITVSLVTSIWLCVDGVRLTARVPARF